MKYNPEFIKDFPEEEYRKFLKNSNYLSNLKDSYLNMYSTNPNTPTDVIYILFKESLDHYVYQELINNPNFIDTIEMRNYINYVINIYNYSTMEFNTNIVLRDDNLRKRIIDKYLPKYRDVLEKRSNSDNLLCDEIIDKIKANKSITQSELNYACEYISKLRLPQLKENEILLKYIFGPMKDSNLKLSYQVENLILSYIPYFYENEKGYTQNKRIILGDTDRGKKINGPGHSSPSSNYVALSKEIFSNVDLNSIENSNVERLNCGNDITFFMIVSFHEITHQVQKDQSKNEIYNPLGMSYIIRQVLNKELKDYKTNHDSDGIEIDANLYGWKNSSLFFNKFYSGHLKERLTRNCTVNSRTSRIRRVFAYKKDLNGIYYPYDEYDISNLIKIVREKPDYVTKYPMLKTFFNSKGEIKLSFMVKNNLYTDTTAMEFVHYFIRTDCIEKMIDILGKRKLKDDEVSCLLNNIYYYIKQSSEKKEKLNYVLYHESAGEYRNNEEFSSEVANKIGQLHTENAVDAYKKALPLFYKLYAIYPNCRSYVEWIINCLDSCLEFDSNTIENDHFSNKVL